MELKFDTANDIDTELGIDNKNNNNFRYELKL